MAKKGEKMSREYKEKISQGRKTFYAKGGVHNWTGKKLSDKTKIKISQKAIGNTRRKGFKNSIEHNEAVRKAMLNNKHGLIHGLSKTKDYGSKKGYKKILKSFGFTLEDYENLIKKQRGMCKICKNIPKRRLHLDHSHKTGKFRAFICGNCNLGLGLFKDDIKLLLQASKYIAKYE